MYIAPNYHITLQEWNYDKDHVHILFKAHPKSEISKCINAYKSASSRLLKKEFPCLREKRWKEYFWSQSFCLLTTGVAPLKWFVSISIARGRKQEGGNMANKACKFRMYPNKHPWWRDAFVICVNHKENKTVGRTGIACWYCQNYLAWAGSPYLLQKIIQWMIFC